MTDKRAAQWLLALSGVLLAVRLYAAEVVGFGDSEALYAAYARHPQAAYRDHPGLVGLFARWLGGGDAPFPTTTHRVTAVLATLAPWALVFAARSAGAPPGRALLAALLFAVVPEIAVGLFALTPDLLLVFAWLFSLAFAARALSSEPKSERAFLGFLLAGFFAGLGAAAKVTGGALVVALAVAYLAPSARKHAKTAWPWVGLLLGLVVVAPVLLHEAASGFPMLQHRLVHTQRDAGFSGRNAAALVFGQLAYLSPVFAVAAAFLLVALAKRAKGAWRSDPVLSLLALSAFVPLVLLVPLCLWSRVAEPHWVAPPLLALPLFAATTPFARPSKKTLAWGFGIALTMVTVAHAWVLVPAVSHTFVPDEHAPFDISRELFGWDEAAKAVRRIASEHRIPASSPTEPAIEDVVVVGPHWVVCAQLETALRDAFPVACVSEGYDDYDTWVPRAMWRGAEAVVFVRDDRFDDDAPARFPDRSLLKTETLQVKRGGAPIREFTIEVWLRRGGA